MKYFTQIFIALTLFIVSLYNYLQVLNERTHLRMELPEIQQRQLDLEIERDALRQELDTQFNIKTLTKKLDEDAFRHLRHYSSPKRLPSSTGDT